MKLNRQIAKVKMKFIGQWKKKIRNPNQKQCFSDTTCLKRERRDPRGLEHYKEFQYIYGLLRQEMMEKWNRCVPLSDLLTNRWEKASFLGFGQGCSIYDSSLVIGDVQVGENTWIGPNTILDGSGGLIVGAFCSISAGVQIYTHDSVPWALNGGKKEIERSPTLIGSRCYIGPNSIIGKGVSIGDGCMIGGMSMVLDDIPTGSKAYGIPAKVTQE